MLIIEVKAQAGQYKNSEGGCFTQNPRVLSAAITMVWQYYAELFENAIVARCMLISQVKNSENFGFDMEISV